MHNIAYGIHQVCPSALHRWTPSCSTAINKGGCHSISLSQQGYPSLWQYRTLRNHGYAHVPAVVHMREVHQSAGPALFSSISFPDVLPGFDQTPQHAVRSGNLCVHIYLYMLDLHTTPCAMFLQAEILTTTFPLTWPRSAYLCASLPVISASQCAARLELVLWSLCITHEEDKLQHHRSTPHMGYCADHNNLLVVCCGHV